jgi:IgA Peptidase M64
MMSRPRSSTSRALLTACLAALTAVIARAQVTVYPPTGTGGSHVVLVISDGYAANEQWMFDRAVNGLIVNGLMSDPFYQAHGGSFTIRKLFKPVALSGQTQFGITANYDITRCYIDYDATTSNAIVHATSAFFEKAVIVGNIEGVAMGCTPRNNVWMYVSAGAREMGGVLEHEFGHLVAGLLDEYELFDAPYVGPPGPPLDGPNCSTNTGSPPPIWGTLSIPASIAAPTNQAGCNLYSKGVIRPYDMCMMRAAGAPFCYVCQFRMGERLDDYAFPPPSAPTNMRIAGAGLMMQVPAPPPTPEARSNNPSMRVLLQVTRANRVAQVLSVTDVVAPLIDRTRRVGNLAYAIHEAGQRTITGVIPGEVFEDRPYGNGSAPHLRQNAPTAIVSLVIPNASRQGIQTRNLSIALYQLDPASGDANVTEQTLNRLLAAQRATPMGDVDAAALRSAARGVPQVPPVAGRAQANR